MPPLNTQLGPNTLGALFSAQSNAAPTNPQTPANAPTPAPSPERATSPASFAPAPHFNPTPDSGMGVSPMNPAGSGMGVSPMSPTPKLESISLDAVIGGALMQLRFSGNTNPATLKNYLLSLDPHAQVRSEFPSKSFGAPRETKTARVLVVTLKKYNGALTIEFLCQTPEGDSITAAPFRNNAEKLTQTVAALPRLTPANKAKIDQILTATTGNPTVPLILQPDEQFGVKHWEKDGNHIAEEITPDPPTA